jgi:hypothetical protein
MFAMVPPVPSRQGCKVDAARHAPGGRDPLTDNDALLRAASHDPLIKKPP